MPSPVDAVKERLDILQVVGQVVQLKRAGRTYKGLCPFHKERTPSFVVFPDTQSYYCFGCGESGDAITFVMKHQGLSFKEALQSLARTAGIDLDPLLERHHEPKDRLLTLTSAAAHFYQQALRSDPDAEKAVAFLTQKGLARSTWDLFGLGYAPRDGVKLVQHLEARGFSTAEMEAAGVTVEGPTGPRDRFRGRLIVPIRDREGQVRGFAGRSLDGTEPKYLNSPQTDLFDKGALLFGLDLAQKAIKEAGIAVIVEGYTDVMAAHQAGLANVVATMGTALTQRQARHLARLASTVVLALDADAAGTTAAIREVEALRQSLGRPRATVGWGGVLVASQQMDLEVKVAKLPPGKDPDEVIREDPELWRRIIAEAESVVEYYISYYIERADLSSGRGKSRLVQDLKPVLQAVKDPVEREHYIQLVASRIGLSAQAVHRALQAHFRAAVGSMEPPKGKADSADPADHLLAFLLRYPQALQLEHDLTYDDFLRADDKLIFGTLARAVYNEPNLDTQRVLELMDGALRERAADLARTMVSQPDLDPNLLDRALRLQILRHRDTLLRLRLHQHRAALRAAEEEGDAEAVGRIAADIRRIALRLSELGAGPQQKTH